jgi:hypothetical protein
MLLEKLESFFYKNKMFVLLLLESKLPSFFQLLRSDVKENWLV